uniref:Cilia- and flagella-associated protein 91 n=1 Tax=Macrostomum lignano TaxID=282301 RepID=A0A1I8JK68_9PLAT
MAQSQTQTIQRSHAVNEARPFDYLYDPVHTTSSVRDHARATFQAYTSSQRLQRVPVQGSMFSDLRHYPRLQLRISQHDPVPKFVNRQWKGYADQARDALIRYKKFNYDPSVEIPARHYQDAHVTGKNRALFFRRPIIPFMQGVPPDVVLATTRPEAYMDGGVFFEDDPQRRPETPAVRSVACQTVFRDGETQTEPYTPEYVVRPGEQPEVLTLATLSWRRGLPAGLAEVEMIERARFKRQWEASLPPLSDVSQLERRQRMMEEMERYEWAQREEEIEKLQAARLEVLKRLLRQRQENQEDLLKKRKAVEGRLERRDIVRDYADPGSQSFAPLTRVGVFLDRGSEQYVVRNRYLTTYDGLCELENSLPAFVTQPRIKAPKPAKVTSDGFVKRQYRRENELAEFHDEQLKRKKQPAELTPALPKPSVLAKYTKQVKAGKDAEAKKPLRFLQKIEKPVPRPPTPTVPEPAEEEEERELSVIFLQQLIRGRAVQSMMFEGKEKRRELIKELRSTHALQRQEQLAKKEERLATLALQRQRRLHQHREWTVEEVLGDVEGQSLGNVADFLTKELVRLQEERRVHAFAMLAERQRRIREAEESGRRQVEERRRREEDEIFKQLVKVQQETVDTYLQDVILSSNERAADDLARREVTQLAATLNDIAYETESRRGQLESEEMTAELVHQFLIPEVNRQAVRERLQQQQRRFLLAAHREIHESSDAVIASASEASAAAPTDSDSLPPPQTSAEAALQTEAANETAAEAAADE